ncbi:MAG: SDR family NAD(P)-dependent oxidoreductase, partial [Methanococcaceae archaeon]
MKKNLIIFGAASALARGSLESFLHEGYDKIYLFDRHPFQLPGNPENVSFYKTEDLTNPVNMDKAFSNIEPDMGTLYFLLNTIGGFSAGLKVWDSDPSEVNKMLDMNFHISYSIARCFGNLVSKSAGGSICFVSSMTSFSAESNKAAYGISKNALNYLVEVLALEGRDINMTVNAIAPFILDTEINRSWITQETDLISPREAGQL